MIDVDSPSLELAEVLKLICKVFWSATWMGIPDILLQESQFVGWMTGFHKLLVKPVPQVNARRLYAVHNASSFEIKPWIMHFQFLSSRLVLSRSAMACLCAQWGSAAH